MKRLFLLLLIVCLCLTACGGPGTSRAGEDETGAVSGSTADGADAVSPDGGDAENTVNVPAPTAEEFRDLFLSCTGYQGSAGASLRNAIRAYEIVKFAADHDLANVDEEELRTALLDGYTQMDEDARAEFHLNFAAYITPLAEDAFTAWNSVKDSFEDAGVREDMEELSQTPGAFEDWNALRSYVFIMGNEMS